MPDPRLLDDLLGAQTDAVVKLKRQYTELSLQEAQDVSSGGSPTFTALTLSGLTANRVVYTGVGGLLSADAGFTYNAATDTATLLGGLNMGTGAGAGAGDIRASGQLKVAGTAIFGSASASPGRNVEVNYAAPYVKFNGHATGNPHTIGVDGAGFIIFNDTASAYRLIMDNDGGLYMGGATGSSKGIGTLNLRGSLFYQGTQVVTARQSAYTQTYATASKTHPNATSANFPAGGAGTAAGGWSTAANRDLAITRFNALRVDVDNLKNLVNAIIDDGQAHGLWG